MKISQRRYRRIGISSLFTVLAVTIILGGMLASSAKIFAGGNSGGADTGGSSGCRWTDGSLKNPNSCIGGVWMKYPLTQEDKARGYISFPGFYNGGANGYLPLDQCGDADSYYRLALVDIDKSYDTTTGKSLKDTYESEGGIKNKIYAVQYQGTVWPLYEFGLSGNSSASSTFYLNTTNGEDWGSVNRKFEVAKQHGAGMNGREWNSSSDLALFCYSDSWEKPSGQVSSTSTVQLPVQPSVPDVITNTSDRDDTSLTKANIVHTTAQEETTVEFWHNLYFDPDRSMRSIDRYGRSTQNEYARQKIHEIANYTMISLLRNCRYYNQTDLEACEARAEERYYEIMERLNQVPESVTNQFADVTGKYSIAETSAKNKEFKVRPGSTNGYDWRWEQEVERESVTVKLAVGETKTVCRTITYSPKYIIYAGDPNRETNTVTINGMYSLERLDYETKVSYAGAQTSGRGSSKACATITRQTIQTGQGDFWSTSTITVPAQNDIPSEYKLTSNKSGTAEIKLSTDAPSINVIFSHNLYYSDKLWNPAAHGDTYNWDTSHYSHFIKDICARYQVEWGGTSMSGNVGGGALCTNNAGDNSGKEVSRTEHTINLNPGETVQVCQKITHDHVKVTLHKRPYNPTHGCRRACTNGGCCSYYYHPYNTYEQFDFDGEASSQSCVTVTRPENPPDGDPKDPNTPDGPKYEVVTGSPLTDGNPTARVMFAGETSSLKWDVKAPGIDTRRVVKYQAVAFDVAANKRYNDQNVIGTTKLVNPYPGRNNQAPCDYWNAKIANWCGTVGNREGDYKDEDSMKTQTYNQQETIAVPDEVGSKYCTSFGFKWEYWYAYILDGIEDWHHESSLDYWTHYNASCRTVAKKPSTEFSNSGILTNGGVTTSTATRFNDMMNKTAPILSSQAGGRKIYGSWTEYLAAVNGSVKGFSSGAGLSRGGSGDVNTLTISNAGGLGSSGITTSSTLRTRLDAYLNSKAQVVSSDDVNRLGTNVEGTHILRVENDLNLTNNIILRNESDSIYELPQVVIFVNGNVNISDSVTQVDAWIISTGNDHELDTCMEFVSGTTQTKVNGWQENTHCDHKLEINGPVLVGQTRYNRTYGSDPSTSTNRYTPAETFSLSAENYLWAYAQAGRYDSSYTEGYSRELAPRY